MSTNINLFEIYLIQKITRVETLVETLTREHTAICPTRDATAVSVKCNCGADEYNAKINLILNELKIDLKQN